MYSKTNPPENIYENLLNPLKNNSFSAAAQNPLSDIPMIEENQAQELLRQLSKSRPRAKKANKPQEKSKQSSPSQGIVPKGNARISLSDLPFDPKVIPLPILGKLDENARNEAGKKFEKGLERVAAPVQALMAISPLGGRQAYNPSPNQMKAPWPPAANAPSRNITPQIRPEVAPRPSVALPSSSGLAPKGDAYKFSQKGGKEFLKKSQSPKNETPDWVKGGAEFLKMKQLEKFIKDSEAVENPLLKQLVRAGENLVSRQKTGKNAPLRQGDLEKRQSNTKRPWLEHFSGPIE
ncbi:hypothetical protein UFOVP434_69 [uncultured Caudovirales phage]|uniref:Uncharacterized protein n=1 Tax=uncultured Caudovirales phage TaxID=2100421 RepID=A0A6J5MDM2_9CAUD|nr:hypothetical protein UFOVP434_69 [uncultured Caudovirales phage]